MILFVSRQTIRISKHQVFKRRKITGRDRRPAERFFREILRILRENATQTERLHESVAHSQRICRMVVAIRSDQGAQVIAKGDVYRWTVVDGAHANLEKYIGCLAGGFGEQVCHWP